jgi:hypothetical protein
LSLLYTRIKWPPDLRILHLGPAECPKTVLLILAREYVLPRNLASRRRFVDTLRVVFFPLGGFSFFFFFFPIGECRFCVLFSNFHFRISLSNLIFGLARPSAKLRFSDLPAQWKKHEKKYSSLRIILPPFLITSWPFR